MASGALTAWRKCFLRSGQIEGGAVSERGEEEKQKHRSWQTKSSRDEGAEEGCRGGQSPTGGQRETLIKFCDIRMFR